MRFGVSATVMLACALSCTTARAASVSVGASLSSETVVYVADPGETNTVTVADAGDELRVRDTGAPLRAVSPLPGGRRTRGALPTADVPRDPTCQPR